MKIFEFPSKSTPGQVHTTKLHDDGSITCSCRGFGSSKTKECTHVKQVQASEGVTATKPPEQMAMFEQPTGFIPPMLATNPTEIPLDEYDPRIWVMEEKFDGHRMIIRCYDGNIVAWSRQGNIRRLSSKLNNQLKVLANGIYDGELVIPGGVHTDVVALDKVENAELRIFDLLRLNDMDLMLKPAYNRRQILVSAMSAIQASSPVQLVDQYNPSHSTLEGFWERGGEGAILKNAYEVYIPGKRAKHWIKYKKYIAATITITGYLKGELGPHSRIVGKDQNGIEVKVKTLNDHWRHVFSTRADEFIGKELNIEHQGITRKGKYQSPMADHFPNGEL